MEYLLAKTKFVSSKVVVELGAGTGVTGMLCKKLGSTSVFLTDHDQRSIDHMMLDIERNGISACVIHLDWYNYDHEATLQLMQQSNDLSSAPLRIVAGDVLYKDALIMPFLNVISSLLKSCAGSEMLLCHVPRAGVEQNQVTESFELHGLNIKKVAHEEWKKGIVLKYSTPDDYNRAELYHITNK